MSGLELAKETSLKICPCKIVSENVSCEISLIEIENIIRQNFKNPRADFVAVADSKYHFGKI